MVSRNRSEDDNSLAKNPSTWGILIFSLIGATTTTILISQLRRTYQRLYSEIHRSQSSWRKSGIKSNYGSFREEAWRTYNHRMQEEYAEEMERVERIRRMQSVFNREKEKYKRSYENWREYGPGAYQYYQHSPGDDWYWNFDANTYWRTNSKSTPNGGGAHMMSHHYSVLGLDRFRTKPYSDAEIKTAFRRKAMEYHPDQNLSNKKAAEAKFKEVMTSYEAIKLGRNDKR